MMTQRLLIPLTVVNLVLLVISLAQARAPATEGIAPILRGRALEIIDDRGRVRASIKLHSEDPAVTMPDGKAYPETVMFRLIDPNGRPNVKLGASEQGAGLGLAGESEPTYIVLQAQRTSTSVKLTNKDGRQQLITP
jgi:hypothetical protein